MGKIAETVFMFHKFKSSSVLCWQPLNLMQKECHWSLLVALKELPLGSLNVSDVNQIRGELGGEDGRLH